MRSCWCWENGSEPRTHLFSDGEVDFVGVVDKNEKRANEIVEGWGGKVFATIEELVGSGELPGVDAVTIATPTVCHIEVAEPLLERGIGCLIEKPYVDTESGSMAIRTAERIM